MNYLSLPYIYIILLSLFYSVTASSQSVAFNHLTTKEGLSQLSVNSIYVDEFGILWIGTRVGLNIYDGQKIHTINKEKSDPNSLPSNIILQVTGNKDGKVYILSPDCVSELNIMTQRFKILKEDKIGCIYYRDKLYITIGNSILTYNDNGSFETFYTLPDNSIKAINSLIVDDEGNMWIGTPSYGVFKYDTQNSTTKHVIEHGNITQMYIDQEKTLWIGSWENGLYTIKKDGEINNYKTSDIKRSISSDFVRAICQDNQGNIWIGTSNGIDKYDRTNSEFIHYSSGETDHDLTDSSVWCIEKDAQGTLWIGTYFGGVNYVNPEYSIYRRYYYSKEEGKGLSSPVIGRMTENKDGKIWIATEGGGVNLLDRTSRTIKWPKGISGPSNSLSHNNVKSLYYDENQNTLWIGTHTGGLNKYDIKTGRITLYMHHSGNETSLPSNIIRDIEPYTSDSLIIATQNGICIMEKESGKCRHILRNLPNGKSLGMVADITLDKNNNLWIAATGEGVYVYNMSSSNVKNYRNDTTREGSISSNNINNIITDSKNNIWICTSGCGLDLYIPETDSFRNFDKQNNNLANDCIYQACESPVTGNLLLITTDGFSIFDKEKKIFYNYNSQNGFPIDAVNENALYIASDGEVFLGGIRNMVSFYEKDLFLKHKPYSIILTGLVVNGNYINVGDKTGILKESLNYTRQITLSHKENIFSIDFAVTNHIPENRDKIIYKLEGFSEQWNEVRNSNEITYTNLNPGSYTLIIKAQNEDTSICKPIRVDIKIKTPFYKTPIAYIIYTLSAVLLLWYIISIYITRLRLSESLKLEQKHAENIKKENQAQLKLFTNISHEFRTPLTLIISQIETLIQNNRFTNQTYNKLSIAYHNCMQLRELITELLDYRKHEMGHLKLQVCHNDIIHFIRENYILFSDYASKNNITIEFNTEYESLDLWFDPKHFQKVINNLLFNAIKSTGNGGKISIEVKKDNKNAIISISDNGKGIPAKDIDKIFDIFYQVEDSNSSIPGTTGSGIGLAFVKTIIDMHHGNIKVSSKEGEGSTFSISLPLGNAHFSKSEIIFSQPTDYSPPVFNSPTPIIQSDESESTTEIAEISSKLQSKPQMFIVEDNEQIRAMLKEILSPFYYIRSFATAESVIFLILMYAANKSTYGNREVSAVIVTSKNNRVHTSFSQTVANTGRLASSNPNLQNIPIRSDEGKKIRECFIAKEGCKIIASDYSQVELRLLASVADVKGLKHAFEQGIDIHAATAAKVFGVPYEEVDANMRRHAKAINFGIVYGISQYGLAKQIDVSNEEAKKYIDAYFAQMPEIKRYMDETIQFAHTNGYVLTPFGRKCSVMGINDQNKRIVANAERAAINAPIQGGAADIIKRAMIAVQRELEAGGYKTKMLLQVHDELVFEAPIEEVEEVSALIKRTMENVVDLAVPFVAEVGIGDNWTQAH